ncbi:amino acid ABC transporter permease [Gemmobacter denitrificans]|uniref:ABC transporter permease subunit n=1 Tax=Gemmobacter denitrificans TaxID=3123040 RepID=A0ABU8BXH9_9RHOB
MAFVQDTPKADFRLSMLIYDTRYRSLTIQVVVLGLFLLFLSWLVNNTIQNLAAKDRTFEFGFLWARAGYDINQTLISYTNDSPHYRAAMVGLLNTLLAAVIGCGLATVIGVIVGVLRLSKNWLVGRMMTVYVEMFRNVPVLLWILLAFTILSEATPEPSAYRVTDAMIAAGEAPKASMLLNDSLAITTRSTNIPAPMVDNGLPRLEFLGLSLNSNVLAFLIVFGGSLYANSLLRAHAKRVQEETGVRPTTWWKSLAVLVLPTAALLWWLGFHLDYPTLTRFNFKGGIEVGHSFTALTIALALYTAAFIAEIVRAGIMAISRGQSEAAAALGLRPGRTMSLVILPQALRVIIPPLISQYLNLTKNTSLAIAVSYMDLRGTLGGITLNQTGKELECMLLMMAIYLTISLIISSLMNMFNRAVRLKER